MKLRLVCWLWLLLLWPGEGLCAWQAFRLQDGLGSNSVSAIAADRNGGLWFANGTEVGYDETGVLTHCDGFNWTRYPYPGQGGFSEMLVDATGLLWLHHGVSTFGSCVTFDGSHWTQDGMPQNVTTMFRDREGGIWVATNGFGIYRHYLGSWSHYTTADGLPDDSVWGVAEAPDGVYWFATDDSLCKLEASVITVTQPNGWMSETYWQGGGLFGQQSGALWTHTWSSGIARWDGAAWRCFTVPGGWDTFLQGLEDSRGNVWFAGGGEGVLRWDGTSWTRFTTEDGLADNYPGMLFEDNLGRVWAARGPDPYRSSRGASRFDGFQWTSYSTDDGLVSNGVTTMATDPAGNVWFGSDSDGATRHDGVIWKSYAPPSLPYDFTVTCGVRDREGSVWLGTDGDGILRFNGIDWTWYGYPYPLPSGEVTEAVMDSTGAVWFAYPWGSFGVTRYAHGSWQTFTTANGLPFDEMWSLAVAADGALWACGSGHIGRFKDSSWVAVEAPPELGYPYSFWSIRTTRDGKIWLLSERQIFSYDGRAWTKLRSAPDDLGYYYAMLQDHTGALWFGAELGVARYDTTSAQWTVYRLGVDYQGNGVWDIAEDVTGRLWFGTYEGVNQFGGTGWVSDIRRDDGRPLLSPAIMTDATGRLWFGTQDGVVMHEPDRIPSQTAFAVAPPPLSVSRLQTAVAAAGFAETDGIQYSFSLDGPPWSAFSPSPVWSKDNLPDGIHTLQARSADRGGSIDPTPASAVFEIDATPPSPILAAPASGQILKGTLAVMGDVSDSRLLEYRLDVRPSSVGSWSDPGVTNLVTGYASPLSGILGYWDTTDFPDGLYDLRLLALDRLGLAGSVAVRVTVDNLAPWATETSPVRIRAGDGGLVISADGNATLSVPPHAFDRDTEVTVEAMPSGMSGAAPVPLAVYKVAWSEGARLRRALLDVRHAALGEPSQAWALWVQADSSWQRLGGTLNRDAHTLSLGITASGLFAIMEDSTGIAAEPGVTGLWVAPRVLVLRGGAAESRAAIGFDLGRSQPVSIRVFNRAGRLVRVIASEVEMRAGANVVYWDGSDADGRALPEDAYLVNLEVGHERQSKVISILR